jgi:hypothetical protein
LHEFLALREIVGHGCIAADLTDSLVSSQSAVLIADTEQPYSEHHDVRQREAAAK